MTQPKPCPFCGSSDTAVDEVDDWVYAVICLKCDATGPTIGRQVGGTEEERKQAARDAWDARV